MGGGGGGGGVERRESSSAKKKELQTLLKVTGVWVQFGAQAGVTILHRVFGRIL